VTHLFGYSLDTIALALLIVSASLLLVMGLLAAGRPVLLRIALRQLPRRRAQMVLVALGLSLGASIITSVFLTGATVQTAIHVQVVAGLGRTDEILHDAAGPYVRGDVDLGNLTGIDTNAPNAAGQAVFLDELSGRLVTQAESPPEVYFPESVTGSMQSRLAGSTVIQALLGDAVEHGALLTDQTSRQIRGEVKVIGLPSAIPSAFGLLRDSPGRSVHIGRLPPGTAAINAVTAADLGARTGDHLLLFLRNKRYDLRLDVITINGGLAGSTPTLLLPLSTLQTMVGHLGEIDRILVVNRGVDADAEAANSFAARQELYGAAPYNLSVDDAKAEGLREADAAEEIFSRIFTLFALFTAGVGLLLVFLIFTILAAERRPEMGIGRVVGMKRRDLIVQYLFEGTIYALVAAGLGVGLGIAIGASIVALLDRVLDNYGFGLAFVVHPRVAAISYGLGLLATWLTVLLACWWATRLTISSAIRDLPEPDDASPNTRRMLLRPWIRLVRALIQNRGIGRRLRAMRRFAGDLALSLLGAVLALCLRGPGLTVIGLLIARLSADAGQSGAWSCAPYGYGPATRTGSRLPWPVSS
jgi:putative ABC transport system permease protein